MKVLGISIEANKAIFSALEKDANQMITEIPNAPKKLELKDHLDSKEVRSFTKDLHAYLEQQAFDKVGIITRGMKGRFAASPISFKIEGLIQLSPNTEIEFIAPATLRAYYKKNENSVEPKYSYQKDACDLAFYLINH
jgi:hypothetical protein